MFNIGEAHVTSQPSGIVAVVNAAWFLSSTRPGKRATWTRLESALVDVAPSSSRAEFTRSKDDVSDARFPIRVKESVVRGCVIVADCWWREPFWELDLGERWSLDSRAKLEQTITAITIEDCRENYLEDPNPVFPVHVLLFSGSVKDRVRKSTTIFEPQGATPLPPRLDDAMRLASYSVRFSLGDYMESTGNRRKGTFTWNLASDRLGKDVRYIRIQARGPKYFKIGRVKVMSTPARQEARDESRCMHEVETIFASSVGGRRSVEQARPGPVCVDL